ncbi:peptidoglycan-associated lipoprotein Pal [Cognatishimia sp. MH4019]|uniref:peptidoglycan-associated lipoprotein Pal n=1 Tax=Cognatishimia sp. MH4019 TaxID=2854030 RepID=UPI001CD802F2|nr:peptidoglycan-associated lipoprotein Pal [Cognatishimia sp. MH4019]
MNSLKIAVLVGAAFALGACTNAGRFDNDGGFGADGAGAGFDVGSAQDPNSPAYFSQTIGDRVLFLVDQSSLTPQAQTVLAGQAAWLANNPEFTAVIEGHADEQGTREYNLALGARRANAVQEYLVSQGVAATRLQTLTFGKERPLEICSDESCYAKNRRAVTVIAAGGTS